MYTPQGNCQLIELPFSGTLQAGKTYTFAIRPEYGIKWALINGDDWHTDWEMDEENNCLRQSITLSQTGRLRLSVQTEQGGSYHACVAYEVIE